jgi:TolA-binding protein
MRRTIAIAAIAASLALGGRAAYAQDTGALDQRVDRLEGQMRAVQRKVFPGGAGQWMEPQITPAEPSGLAGPGSSNPVTDLTVRVNSLEMQLSSLTNQMEQGQHDLRVLRDEFEAYKSAHAAPPPAAAPETGSADLGTADAAPLGDSVASGSPDTGGNGLQLPASAGGPTRADRVAAVEKPSSGDPAEDAYIYGYRLWMAKLYPEAEKQLKSVVAKYPQHRRASFAQNLLGRAYLDEGKPSLASIAFYDNYKKMPDGERAADSLYYLAQALMELEKPKDACKVYGELTDVYAGRISASMQADIAAGRDKAGCQ